jgi:hypothetical protein
LPEIEVDDGSKLFALLFELKVNPNELVADDAYVQRATKAMRGCQIDYMIQTKFNTLFVCEIKFSRHPIGMDVVKALQNKVAALATPKNFAVLPVLIHEGKIRVATQPRLPACSSPEVNLHLSSFSSSA